MTLLQDRKQMDIQDAAAEVNCYARDVASVRKTQELNDERKSKGSRMHAPRWFFQAD